MAWIDNVGIIHDRRIHSCTRHVIVAIDIVVIKFEFLKAKKIGIQQINAAHEKFIGGNEAVKSRPLPIARSIILLSGFNIINEVVYKYMKIFHFDQM